MIHIAQQALRLGLLVTHNELVDALQERTLLGASLLGVTGPARCILLILQLGLALGPPPRTLLGTQPLCVVGAPLLFELFLPDVVAVDHDVGVLAGEAGDEAARDLGRQGAQGVVLGLD